MKTEVKFIYLLFILIFFEDNLLCKEIKEIMINKSVRNSYILALTELIIDEN